MCNIKIISCVVLLFLSNYSIAQFRIKVTITDEFTHKIIPFASLQLLQGEESINYDISNKYGEVIFTNIIAGKYKIICRRLDYSNYQEELIITQNSEFKIALKKRIIKLENVVLKQSKYGKIKGDTINYNLKTLLNKTENNILDVIKKLPGTEVTKDGDITVDGKPIDYLLIDGKNVLGKNYYSAIKNIPAKSLDGISLYDNYKNKFQFEKRDENALNLKLNKKYKGVFSTNIDFLGAVKNRYLVNNFFYYFGKNTTIFGSVNSNNLGESPISIKDFIINFRGIDDLLESDGYQNSKTLSNDEVPHFIFLKYTNPKRLLLHNISFNIYNNTLKSLELKAYLIANHAKINAFKNEHIISENNILKRKYNKQQKNNYLQAVFNSTYRVSKSALIKYNFFNAYDNDIEYEENESYFPYPLIRDNTIKEKKNFFSQSINSQIKVLKNMTLKTIISHEYRQNENTINIKSSEEPTAYFPKKKIIKQKSQKKQNDFQGKIILKYNFNKNLFLQSSLNINKAQENYHVQRFTFLKQQQLIKKTLSSSFVIGNKKKQNIFNYFTGINIVKQKINSIQQRTFFKLLPFIELNLSLSNRNSFTFNYKEEIISPSIDEIIQDIVILDMFSVINNQKFVDFSPYKSNKIDVRYAYNNLFNGINFNTSFSYTKEKNPFSKNIYSKDYYLKVITSRNNLNNDLKINTSISKYFTIIPINIKLSYKYRKNNTHTNYNDRDNIIISYLNKFDFKLTSNFKNKSINFKIGGSYNKNIMLQKISEKKVLLNSYYSFLELFGNIFNTITWNLKSGIEISKTTTFNNTINNILSTKIQYKKNNIEFYIQGKNMLNLEKLITLKQKQRYNNVFFIEESSNLPGYIGIGVIFKK